VIVRVVLGLALVIGALSLIDLVTHAGPLVVVVAACCGIWGHRLRRSGA
jgi:hypothetical protein